ncbi:MAG: response regulator transcription factor [Vampirovibrionales bacterium]
MMTQDMLTILIVEPVASVRQQLEHVLSKQGYNIHTCDTAKQARQALESSNTNLALVVLSTELPKEGSWAVLKQSQTLATSHLPVLMLAPTANTEQVVLALNSGADDIMALPVVESELVARCKALIRRCQNLEKEPSLVFGDLTIHLTKQQVFRGGKSMQLTSKEFQLLCYLIKQPTHVASRTQLAQEVWHVSLEQATNMVDVAIRRLRQKIDAPFKHKLVHSVRGVGYRLEPAPVA